VDRVSTNILNMIPDFVGTERMLQYCCSNKLVSVGCVNPAMMRVKHPNLRFDDVAQHAALSQYGTLSVKG